MKRLLKKNQTIVSALAVMLAVAGYLTYAGNTDRTRKNQTTSTYVEAQYEISQEDLLSENSVGLTGTGLSADIGTDVLEDAADTAGQTEKTVLHREEEGLSGDTVVDGETETQTVAQEEDGQNQAAAEDMAEDTDIASLDQDASDLDSVPGEAVLTSGMTVSDFVAQSKLDREQVRGANKEALLNVINNDGATDEEVQGAIDTMVTLTTTAEMESATEMLLKSKGFSDAIVSINGDQVEVVIGKSSLTDAQLAQVEDIRPVHREGARIRRGQGAQDLQEGGFPRPGGAHDGHDFAALRLEINALQHFERAETLLDSFCFDNHTTKIRKKHRIGVVFGKKVVSLPSAISRRLHNAFINKQKTDSQWLLKSDSSATVRRISHSSTLLWPIPVPRVTDVSSSSSAPTTRTPTPPPSSLTATRP